MYWYLKGSCLTDVEGITRPRDEDDDDDDDEDDDDDDEDEEEEEEEQEEDALLGSPLPLTAVRTFC